MRRILACGLVLALTSAWLSPPAGGVAGFGDVDDGRFYTPAVQWMVDEDVTTGTSPTCFSPADFVTRGQAAAFMWRMEGSPPPGADHPFGDIAKDWQQDPVSWMFNNKITTGTTATTFSPDDVLTRGQMAALLYRLEGNPEGSPPHPFLDVVKDWQQDPVSWMAAEEITTGTSATTFSPDDTVTRGQLAAFFYRYKGSPGVMVDPDSPVCPDFTGSIDPQPSFTGSVGFQLTPAGDAIVGFSVTLDMDEYSCPNVSAIISGDMTMEMYLADPVVIDDDTFVYASASQTWFGAISGDIAVGTVEGEIFLMPGVTCDWGPVIWGATRV